MSQIIKYLIISLFSVLIFISILVMIDTYNEAVVQNISQVILCDEIKTSIGDTDSIRTVATCFTYNPQLLFYGQFLIIPVLLLSLKYVYNLSVVFQIKYRKRQIQNEAVAVAQEIKDAERNKEVNDSMC